MMRCRGRPRVDSLLRDAVAADVPVIGHCLGGQLLAKALGAEVGRAPTPEIGWIDVDVDDARAGHAWFGGRTRFETFQWHYEAFALPAGATRVLTNPFNANQAYVVDGSSHRHAVPHRDDVALWSKPGSRPVRANCRAASAPALCSAADIRRGLPARIAALNAVAGDVYARWAQGLER